MTNIAKLSQDIYRIKIAVPVYLYDCFDYQVSSEEYQNIAIGSRVSVSFGRQQLVGIVTEKVPIEIPVDSRFQLKTINEVLDNKALLNLTILKLATWAAQYYQFPIGEVMHSALPSLLRQGKPYNLLARTWKVLDLDAEAKVKRSLKQLDAYRLMKLHPNGTAETILNLNGIETATLKTIEKKGIIQCELAPQDFSPESVQLAQMPLTPNEEQKNAIETILKSKFQYQGFLLDGLTGSGKTEVYLQVMHEVLKLGKQVLVLVPEIGLTPQTVSRFQSRFHCHIALMHSGLNDAKRLQAWQAAQTGKASIILGTRSAIFTPMPNLGLIILDEEHDLSFKQQEGFRYHARDVALYRAHLENCPIVLGSATPSIDSFNLAKQGKLTPLQLNHRAGHASLPKIHLIDLKITKKQHGLSDPLIQEIQTRLDKKEQVLIFLNRRGYAPVLICESCGWQSNCPNCDAHFTLHKNPYEHLHCHHCGTINRVPDHCPQCQQKHLKPIGVGTAKVEEALQVLFPNFPVLRVDRDSTSRVGSWQKIYDQIHKSEPLILLGTQMLAKGHHFPYVSLVAILDIDAGLLSVDFRATERTAQLIIQVAGRAGRGEKKGDVYLQTLRPDHPLLNTLIEKNYRAFAQATLADRQLALLPPSRYAVLLRCESKNQQDNQDFLTTMTQQLKTHAGDLIEIWGPIPAPMERKAGRYQAHVVLLSQHRAKMHYYLSEWWQIMLQQKPSQMKVTIDVDPQELS